MVKLEAADKGCPDACVGLKCPEGWVTGRDKADFCKCICVREDPTKLTPWDQERKRKAEEKAALEKDAQVTGVDTGAARLVAEPGMAAAAQKALSEDVPRSDMGLPSTRDDKAAASEARAGQNPRHQPLLVAVMWACTACE